MQLVLATAHANSKFTPLALLYLKAQLVESGALPADAVRILEFTAGDAPEAIAARVLAQAPDIVGLSCYVWNVTALLEAARLIKAARPAVRVVLGGPEVGPEARSVLEQNPDIDCVVVSEGERVLGALVEAWRNGDDLAPVEGIWFRRGSDIVETPAAAPLLDLNLLASPHLLPDVDPTGRVVCIETQRGCVFKCSFCFYNKDLSIRNRRFDLDRVRSELAFWLQQDIASLYLMDPIFNLYAARAKEICQFIAEHNTRRIPIHTELWAEFVDDELARLMHEANFRYVEVGLQTTEQAVLQNVDRRLRLEQFTAGIDHMRRHDVPFEIHLIHGLPGETPATFSASLNFAAALQPPILSIFQLLVLPGTELRRKADTLGIVFEQAPPYGVVSHATMSAEDIAYGRKIRRAVHRVGRFATLRYLARAADITFADIMDAWIAWSDERSTPDADSATVGIGRFVSDFCAVRGIAPAFFTVSAAAEEQAIASVAAVYQ